jgi:hypothetical protein
MNPIAKKLLYSSLGGAAPGALIGAAVSDEDNRLRNALIGAGLGGTAGAGIYSAKRLGDVRELNKALENELLAVTPRPTTLDDLSDLHGKVITRTDNVDYAEAPLRMGNTEPSSAEAPGYRLVDEMFEFEIPLRKDLPFTDTSYLYPNNAVERGNINIQFNPNNGRTHFYVSDSSGRKDIAGRGIREGLEFSLPGDSRNLANSIKQEALDAFMERVSRERKNLGWDIDKSKDKRVDLFYDRYKNETDLLSEADAKAIFSGGDGLTTRKIVDFSPSLNPGRKATFFSDGASPDFSGRVVHFPSSAEGPHRLEKDSPAYYARLEKRSSLKLRGKARLKQALLNHAAANRR